jgi:hypothetical protein
VDDTQSSDGRQRARARVAGAASVELVAYRFEPAFGHTHADVLLKADRIRVERGVYNIAQIPVVDAFEALVERSRGSLSDDRSPRGPSS